MRRYWRCERSFVVVAVVVAAVADADAAVEMEYPAKAADTDYIVVADYVVADYVVVDNSDRQVVASEAAAIGQAALTTPSL